MPDFFDSGFSQTKNRPPDPFAPRPRIDFISDLIFRSKKATPRTETFWSPIRVSGVAFRLGCLSRVARFRSLGSYRVDGALRIPGWLPSCGGAAGEWVSLDSRPRCRILVIFCPRRASPFECVKSIRRAKTFVVFLRAAGGAVKIWASPLSWPLPRDLWLFTPCFHRACDHRTSRCQKPPASPSASEHDAGSGRVLAGVAVAAAAMASDILEDSYLALEALCPSRRSLVFSIRVLCRWKSRRPQVHSDTGFCRHNTYMSRSALY